MYTQKRDSMIKNALKSLCSSNGWCYAIFWGFDLTNSLLLTFKEGYYEEQMGSLVDSLLLQAHVLGGGVIGQAAFMKTHRWMYSDSLDETQNSFDSVELFQEDSEFFWQFTMGIKTIAVISVEPWGVVQLGSTHKKPEMEGFVDEVKQVFREMDKWSEIKCMENEPSQVFLSNTHLNSQSFLSTSNNQIFPTPENSSNLFDCSSISFFNPMDLDESWTNSSFSTPNDDVLSTCFGKNNKSENLPTSSFQSSVTDSFRYSCKAEMETFGRKETPIGNFVPQCTSNSLFSQLGIDHLLDAIPQSSSKRRKIDNFERNNIELGTKEAHSCVDHRMDTGNTSTSRGQEEQVQSNKKKKKAKAGTRPRPKDRQMIQDRLSELRDLIPNGEKMSIDRLLEGTIKHLNFMQSLTKHASTLKQIDTSKSVEVMKKGSSNCGVTWACEVGEQNMVCPLIVEDLSTPGQMLIEMLCEEQGLFLEIVDIIRGFGLSIQKGVMEVRETNKIWAHFMVEAEGNRFVSRHEIFSSLIQFLQMSGQSASQDHANAIMSSAFTNFEAFPISFPDALQCNGL